MSEKYESMQYSLIWTGYVFLETRCACGDSVSVRRRKMAAFVPAGGKTVTVWFDANQFSGQEIGAVRLGGNPERMSDINTIQASWKLVSQSPIYVDSVRLKRASRDTEDEIIGLGVGACEGVVRVPSFVQIGFDLVRTAPVRDGAA